MSVATNLCVLPPATVSTCCSEASPEVQVPAVIFNAPGLSAIQYRIGTFSSFRQAMLNDVAKPDLLLSGVSTQLSANALASDASIQVQDFAAFPASTPFRIKIGNEYLEVISGAGSPIWAVVRGVDQSTAQDHVINDPVYFDPPNPFLAWREGSSGDYQTMFIELWAYIADVLTFYQERIANEAYLGTATQRDSMMRMAELIDNSPSPGAGASATVAFSVAKGKTAIVPASFRVGSKASPAKVAAVFETSGAITALSEHNQMPVATVLPQDQFGHIPSRLRTIVLAGINNRLSIGDYVVLVINENAVGEMAIAFRLQSVATDKVAGTTRITWNEPAGTSYSDAAASIHLYALRVSASAFGTNAPEYDTLPAALTTGVGSPPNKPAFPENWDDSTKSSYYLPLKGHDSDSGSPRHGYVFLDAVYDAIKASPQIPGWAVLLANSPGPDQVPQLTGTVSSTAIVCHVTDAHAVSATGYTINAKVTRLALGANEIIQTQLFPIRTTTVLAASQRLIVQNALPVTGPVAGSSVVLTGLFPLLKAGQQVVVQGSLASRTPGQTTGEIAGESRVLDGGPVLDTSAGTTTLNFTKALANQYDPARTVVMGNVVDVTQGETVQDEILGSGDATAFQNFTLKKKPLTYLPSTSSEGLAAITSTLLVILNGVAWNQQPNLIESGPSDHDYVVRTNDSGRSAVFFGDGFNGALPPTGRDNIHGKYRKGLGTSGNLPPGAIQQLIDSVPGLQKVSNPVASSGGADPDTIDAIRINAPASVKTFGRAISAQDYASLALQFPSIEKASASWIRVDENLHPVPTPYVQLTVGTSDGTTITDSITGKNLRSYLDNHRDPNIPLRILDYFPVYIDVNLIIDIEPTYGRQATLARVIASLNPGANPDGTHGYFSFENLGFGQSIHLSALYAVVQQIEGVADLRVSTLRRMDLDKNDPTVVRNDIFIRPTELAVIGNDASIPDHGMLTVQLGVGGFVDK